MKNLGFKIIEVAIGKLQIFCRVISLLFTGYIVSLLIYGLLSGNSAEFPGLFDYINTTLDSLVISNKSENLFIAIARSSIIACRIIWAILLCSLLK